MKYFFILMIFLISNYGLSQIELSPNTLSFDIEEVEGHTTFSLMIINHSQDAQSLYWTFEEGNDFPEEWTASVKDFNLCYSYGDYESLPLFPNNVESGDSMLFFFWIRPNGVQGESYGILRLYSDSLFMDEVAATLPLTNSVETSQNDAPILFPNPVMDRYSIKNDNEILYIEILNSNGEIIKHTKHIPGVSHSLTDLNGGSYFVVLKNKNQDVISSFQIFKE